MLTHRPVRYPEPSRLRSGTVVYAEAGTAAAESFWSVSDWSPVDWTGLTSNTLPVPAGLPLPALVAEAGVARTRPVTTAVARQPVAVSEGARRRDWFIPGARIRVASAPAWASG